MTRLVAFLQIAAIMLVASTGIQAFSSPPTLHRHRPPSFAPNQNFQKIPSRMFDPSQMMMPPPPPERPQSVLEAFRRIPGILQQTIQGGITAFVTGYLFAGIWGILRGPLTDRGMNWGTSLGGISAVFALSKGITQQLVGADPNHPLAVAVRNAGLAVFFQRQATWWVMLRSAVLWASLSYFFVKRSQERQKQLGGGGGGSMAELLQAMQGMQGNTSAGGANSSMDSMLKAMQIAQMAQEKDNSSLFGGSTGTSTGGPTTATTQQTNNENVVDVEFSKEPTTNNEEEEEEVEEGEEDDDDDDDFDI